MSNLASILHAFSRIILFLLCISVDCDVSMFACGFCSILRLIMNLAFY